MILDTAGIKYDLNAVVDGVTIRNSQTVVAIRDPALGRQYFTPVNEFNLKYSGQAIFTNPKLK